jgi:hypothetical protein
MHEQVRRTLVAKHVASTRLSPKLRTFYIFARELRHPHRPMSIFQFVATDEPVTYGADVRCRLPEEGTIEYTQRHQTLPP